MRDRKEETDNFFYAERRILDLVKKLAAKGGCPCCTGRALMYVGMHLCTDWMGSAEAADMCAELSDTVRKLNRPALADQTKH
jgi:hypothetical protein